MSTTYAQPAKVVVKPDYCLECKGDRVIRFGGEYIVCPVCKGTGVSHNAIVITISYMRSESQTSIW